MLDMPKPLLCQLLNIICSEQPSSSFRPVSEQTVRNVIANSARKTCQLDPVPTFLLYDCLDALLSYITHVLDESLVSGVF